MSGRSYCSGVERRKKFSGRPPQIAALFVSVIGGHVGRRERRGETLMSSWTTVKGGRTGLMGATALVTAFGALAFGAGADGAHAHAQMPERELSANVRVYEIPAGTMSTALNRLADESGVQIVYDSQLTRALTTRGLSGRHTLNAALSRLLSGTHLNYELSDDGKSAVIVLAQADNGVRNDARNGEMEPLPPIDIYTTAPTPPANQTDGGPYAPGFSPARAQLPIYRDPPGQTLTTVDHKFLESTPMLTVQEALQYSPGVTFQQGLSPRDFVISIRGSGNRVFAPGVRNIMMFEDGFPIVTADGNGRTDVLDPHAFTAIDVYRGPSSAMFGNHAYGGAINFRSFSGREINGLETGSEFGSFGYLNNYVRAGANVADQRLGEFDIAFFASNARGDGYIDHTAYNFDQAKIIGVWKPTPADRFTLKFLAVDSFSDMQTRLSQTAYYLNPYSKYYGCSIALVINSPFCNNLSQPANGITGATTRQSVHQLGTHYDILREIAGARWEHDFDANTTWRTQFTYDYMDVISGTAIPPKLTLGGPVAARGPSVGLNVTTDITNHSSLFGFPATHFLQFYYENLKSTNPSYLQIPNVWHYGMLGAPAGKIDSYHSNIGLRAREEIALTDQLTAAIGFSANWNRVWGVNTVYNYVGVFPFRPTVAQEVAADNDYWNTAPEASLTYRYSPEWQFRARYATGYGTPNFVNLTSTASGVGNNTSLKAQTNMGVDVGVDWTPINNLTVSLTGFNEWFRNEMLQLSTSGFPPVLYWVNVPAAIHRGVEANVDWRPYEGWRFIAAYTYNDQFFTDFRDKLSNTVYYDRRGKRIPNVPPHTLTSRVGYDIPYGDFKGLGAYVEYVFKSAYTIDNANLSTIPGYGLVNLNVHYSHDIPELFVKNFEIYFDVKNVFDRTYVAGANVLSNSLIGNSAIQAPAIILANSTGSAIYAGQPRSFIGGVKFKF
jgi:iron complex outermembrane recepter protein